MKKSGAQQKLRFFHSHSNHSHSTLAFMEFESTEKLQMVYETI